jgi:hypothetical protein
VDHVTTICTDLFKKGDDTLPDMEPVVANQGGDLASRRHLACSIKDRDERDFDAPCCCIVTGGS